MLPALVFGLFRAAVSHRSSWQENMKAWAEAKMAASERENMQEAER